MRMFRDFLKAEIGASLMGEEEFCIKAGLKWDNLIKTLYGDFIPTKRKTIKRICNVLKLDFVKTLNYALDCKKVGR